MSKTNRLNRTLQKLERIPEIWRPRVMSYFIGRAVPFVGTAGIHFKKLSPQEVILQLRNKRKVQNHLSQVHAAATALLAETATGMAVGMNLPDGKIPLMKAMQVNFIRRSIGKITAVASLSKDQIQQLIHQDKGEVEVAVQIKDSTNHEIVECRMIWAWIPRKQ